jgi:hypothetical protein
VPEPLILSRSLFARLFFDDSPIESLVGGYWILCIAIAMYREQQGELRAHALGNGLHFSVTRELWLVYRREARASTAVKSVVGFVVDTIDRNRDALSGRESHAN